MHTCFRYRGKASPDAIMAEICWRAKNLFEDTGYERSTEAMEVEGQEERTEDHDEPHNWGNYQDSDDDSVPNADDNEFDDDD